MPWSSATVAFVECTQKLSMLFLVLRIYCASCQTNAPLSPVCVTGGSLVAVQDLAVHRKLEEQLECWMDSFWLAGTKINWKWHTGEDLPDLFGEVHFFFACGRPEGRVPQLNVITISLYVCPSVCPYV